MGDMRHLTLLLGTMAVMLTGSALADQVQGQLYRCSAPVKKKKVWRQTICSDSKTNALYTFVGRMPDDIVDNSSVNGASCAETSKGSSKGCVYERR